MKPSGESPPVPTENENEPAKTEAASVPVREPQSAVTSNGSPAESPSLDPLSAVRRAIQLALEADDFELADDLTAVLKKRKAAPKPAPVIELADRRKTR